MAIDPPYRLDPFRNIVNISWGEKVYQHFALFTMNWHENTVDYFADQGYDLYSKEAATTTPQGILINGYSFAAYLDTADAHTGDTSYSAWADAVKEIQDAKLRYLGTAWYDRGHHPTGVEGLYFPDLDTAIGHCTDSTYDTVGGFGDGYRDPTGLWVNAQTMIESWVHAGMRGCYIDVYITPDETGASV